MDLQLELGNRLFVEAVLWLASGTRSLLELFVIVQRRAQNSLYANG